MYSAEKNEKKAGEGGETGGALALLECVGGRLAECGRGVWQAGRQ